MIFKLIQYGIKKIAEKVEITFSNPKIFVKSADSEVDKNVVIKITMKKPISSSYKNWVSMSIVMVNASKIPISARE